MLKWITGLLIAAGLILVSVSLYQIFDGKRQVSLALGEAQTLVENTDRTIQTPDNFVKISGDVIGVFKVPKLEMELPILEGTDEPQLAKGVGRMVGTKYPGQDGQILLSGHRDTVFQRVGELVVGDEITVQMEYGEFTYVVKDTYIVDADDRTVIDSTISEQVLTVTTCYPFRYVGNAPQRYIIDAVPKE